MNNAFRKEPDAEKPHVRNSVRDTFGNGCIYSTEQQADESVPEKLHKFRYMCVIWQEYKATQNKINKIQSAEDLSEFRKVSEEMVESIYGNAPDEIKEIYKKILWSLLMKLKVPN